MTRGLLFDLGEEGLNANCAKNKTSIAKTVTCSLKKLPGCGILPRCRWGLRNKYTVRCAVKLWEVTKFGGPTLFNDHWSARGNSRRGRRSSQTEIGSNEQLWHANWGNISLHRLVQAVGFPKSAQLNFLSPVLVWFVDSLTPVGWEVLYWNCSIWLLWLCWHTHLASRASDSNG